MLGEPVSCLFFQIRQTRRQFYGQRDERRVFRSQFSPTSNSVNERVQGSRKQSTHCPCRSFTGVSAFINADGEIAERVKDSKGEELFVSGYLVKNITLSSYKTFYTAYGDIFAYAMICIAVLITIVSLFTHKSNRP